MKSPKITNAMQKKYAGYTVVSLNGKILGIGVDTVAAVEKAKNSEPAIENKEFMISRISPPIRA